MCTNTRVYLGYVRIFNADDSPAHQIESLAKFGLKERDIIVDSAPASGITVKLVQCRRAMRPGHVLVVESLECLGLSLVELLRFLNTLNHGEIDFISLKDALDSTSPQGSSLYTVATAFLTVHSFGLGGLHEIERRQLGRRKSLSSQQIDYLNMRRERCVPVDQLAKELNVSRKTIYRYLKRPEGNEALKTKKKESIGQMELPG